jgi:NAD(P)-dependent dehydrogenase (short-subunit alcohol dehydrogenase family)
LAGQNLRGFAEKVALVTGGVTGVARAVALQLALEGAFVIVQYEPGDDGSRSIVNELQALGTLAVPAVGDIRTAEGVKRVFDVVEASYGRLDLLVNAYDYWQPSDVEHAEIGEWNSALDGGVTSAFQCCRAAIPMMKGRPSPAIVNVSYTAESEVTSLTGIVTSSAIEGLTRGLAKQLKPRVRVNCVSTLSGRSDTAAASDDVARVCVYLLSGEARGVNGEVVKISR